MYRIGTIFPDFFIFHGGLGIALKRICPGRVAKFFGEFSNTRLRAFPGYDIIKNNRFLGVKSRDGVLMPIKMIAIDMDDTLLRDDNTISEYTRQVLKKAMAKGIRIVIATGRMFQAARPAGKQIGLGDVPMVCYTGSLTGLCESGKVLRNVTIDLPLALEILDTVREHGWQAQTYIDDELYVPYRNQNVADYEKQCGVTAHVQGDAFYVPVKAPTKILVMEHDPQIMKEIETVMREKFGSLVNQVKSKPYFFEMNHLSCSKGNALRALADEWGISCEEIMTFGNGNNDVSMLSMTPWGFAVANASEDAKKAAAHETVSNNEDGVAKAIERYMEGDL